MASDIVRAHEVAASLGINPYTDPTFAFVWARGVIEPVVFSRVPAHTVNNMAIANHADRRETGFYGL